LVRIWISPDTSDHFRYVSDVNDELRDQIREMRELGKKPEDFGLMVRKHPESLAITAKRGVAEAHSMVISLAGRRIETTRLPAAVKILRSNDIAVREFLTTLENDDPNGTWNHPDLGFKGKVGVSRHRIADLLEAFRYDRGNLILANSLHSIIRKAIAAPFQEWTVCIVEGSGVGFNLSPGLTLDTAPRRSVRYSPDGSSGSFQVSGSSARLAGSTDLSRSFQPSAKALLDPEVYEVLPRPTLLIYPLVPKLDVKPSGEGQHAKDAAEAESSRAKHAWSKAQDAGLECLMALALGIPGKRGNRAGDVEYLLNGPAIEEYKKEFELSAEDEEDLDD
jgi:hypothetical protein